MTFDVTISDANGGECISTVELAVISGCPNFGDWVWGTQSFSTIGNGYESHTIGGGTWDFTLGVLNNLPANQAQAVLSGTTDYISAGCNMNLHYEITRVGNPARICCNLAVSRMIPPGGFLPIFNKIFPTSGDPDGIYDVPLLLTDPAGATGTVRIQITAQAACLGATGLPQQISFNGALTNI